MNTRLLIAAAVLALALPAAAQNRVVQQAHEVSPADLRIPLNENGTLAFKSCEACNFSVKRVSSDARWIVNGRSVPYRKFQAAMQSIRERDDVTVTVLHHLGKDQITEVSFRVRD